jgi:hypothetical protein
MKTLVKDIVILPFLFTFLSFLSHFSFLPNQSSDSNKGFPDWIYGIIGKSNLQSESDKTPHSISGNLRANGLALSNHNLAIVSTKQTFQTDSGGSFKVSLSIGTYLVSIQNSSNQEIGMFRLLVTRGGGISVEAISPGLSVEANGVSSGKGDNQVATVAFDPVPGTYNSDQSLPGKKQLLSLVDWGRSSPAINITYFPATYFGNYYWTSNSTINNLAGAWIIVFQFGFSAAHGKIENTNYVRCVRGP